MKSNREVGNTFEQELCNLLFDKGFWVKNLKQDSAGQPADIIAVKNKVSYLIDAKVCSDDEFQLSRIEENQDLAMELWRECGNGMGLFALKIRDSDTQIYMISHYTMIAYRKQQSSLSAKEIVELGVPFEKWVKKCK